jgi:hypothetical protein
VKNQDFISKTNYFLSTLSFNPWAVLATWLHVGAPQKYRKNELNTRLLNKNLPRAHRESKFDVLGVHGKLVKYVVNLSKKLKKNYFSSLKLPKQQLTSFWSQGILGIKN